MNSTEMHSELIEHGWRVNLDGRWISPDPNEARFGFSLDAAWRAHQTRAGQPDSHDGDT